MLTVATRRAPATAPASAPVVDGGQGPGFPLAAARQAGLAAAIGLAAVQAVVLLLWAGDPRSSAGLPVAMRVGADAWLLAHHAGLRMPNGHVGLVPLGLTAIPVLLCVRAGRVLATTRGIPRPRRRDLLGIAAAVGVPYGLCACLVAVLAGAPAARPSPVQALFGATGLASLAALAGALSAGRAAAGAPGTAADEPESGAGRPDTTRTVVPPALRVALAAALAALAVLAAGGAAVAAVAVGLHLPDVAGLARDLRPGGFGGVGLLVVQLALLPVGVVWAAAYALGPGFAVGSGSLVTPFHVRLGVLPALPVLGALPDSGRPSPLTLLALLVPLAAGVTAGTVARRGAARSRWVSGVGRAFAAAPMCALGAGVASWLAGGPAGPDSLGTVGPSAWRVALAAGAEVGIVAAVTVVLTAAVGRLRNGRHGRGGTVRKPSKRPLSRPPSPEPALTATSPLAARRH